MPIKTEDFNQDLYDLLKVREYDPVPIDSKGETVAVPQEADVFRFTFKQDGKEYGDAWVTIDKGKNLVLYYNDNIEDVDADDPDTLVSDSFTDLKKHLKYWARRRQLGFELKNRNHLRGDMAQRHHMKQKEQLGEGYYPMGKKASYNDSVPQVKIILQHTRQLEEGEQRFRNIEKIFVENVNGERFLIPTTRPGIARVYGRHIAEGGTPYDEKGKHITSLVEEYTKMAGFVRATKNGQFNESAQRLVNEAVNHYGNLRETLTRMASRRGYNNYFDNWSPVLNEETDDNISLNELFVQETLDPRIESVMPILKKLNKNISENALIAELDNWAEGVIKEKLEEAPGAETLAHDKDIDQKNLKDLDLEEAKKEKSDHLKKIKSLRRQYRDNENENNHTENALLLATHFGTDDEVKGVRSAMAHRDKHGGYSSGDKEAKRHMDHVHSVHKKYSSKLAETENLEEETVEETKVKYEVRDKSGKRLGTWDGIKFKSYDTTAHKHGDIIPAGAKVDKASGPVDAMTDAYVSAGLKEQTDGQLQNIVDDLMSWFETGDFDLSDDDEIDRAIDEYTNPENYEDDEEVPDFTDQEKNILFKRLKQEINKAGIKESEMEEGLDANQKRVGQLGPTEKVAKNSGARGKLVGASESVEMERLKTLSGIK